MPRGPRRRSWDAYTESAPPASSACEARRVSALADGSRAGGSMGERAGMEPGHLHQWQVTPVALS